MVALVTDTKAVMYEVAKEMSLAHPDAKEAADLIVARWALEGDQEAVNEVAREEAALAMIHRARSGETEVAKRFACPNHPIQRRHDIPGEVAARRAFLDTMWVGPKALRTCTAADLTAEASRSMATGIGQLKRSAFLKTLADRLSDGQTVGDAVTDREAEKLWDDTDRLEWQRKKAK